MRTNSGEPDQSNVSARHQSITLSVRRRKQQYTINKNLIIIIEYT